MPVKCENRYFDHYWKEEFCRAEGKPCKCVCKKCPARAWCTDYTKEEMEDGRN